MRDVRISHLIEHPEYVPQLAQWLFEQWDFILGEKSPETRIEELSAQMNRDELPIAWVAHGNGQLFGTAALRMVRRSRVACTLCHRTARAKDTGQVLSIPCVKTTPVCPA